MKTTYLPLSWILAISGFFISSRVRADAPLTDETPVHTSLTALGEIAPQYFAAYDNVDGVDGGADVVSDAAGNYYHATGPSIAKYDSEGVLLWSQTQSPHVKVTGTEEQPQFNYYDRWTNAQSAIVEIQLDSGNYKGDLAALYAQKIILDDEGTVYVNFLDIYHQDRSVVAKFDGTTGAVEWVGRVALVPEEEEASGKYVSKLVGFAVLPDKSVAVMETGIGADRYAFTRLVIFAQHGISQNGVQSRAFDRIFLNDGGTRYRMTVGVGMDVGADGTIYYATYEGVDPLQQDPPLDSYPRPNSLVLRKLAAPYTENPTELAYTTSQIRSWNDLKIGPGGRVYTLGSQPNSDDRLEPVLAGFDPADFSTELPLTSYPSPQFFGSLRELAGIRLFSTGTTNDDYLYLTTGTAETFREDLELNGGFMPISSGQAPLDMFVTKLDAEGDIVWQKHEPISTVYEAFTDSSDNVYFLGYNYESEGLIFYKYSPDGVFQVASFVNAESEHTVDGRFRGMITAANNIVIAFPQRPPAGDDYANAFKSRLALFENPENGAAAISIDFPEFTSSAYPGEVLTLSATASNGQPVFFHIPFGDDIAYINGNSLVLLRPGLISVQAYQPNGGGFIFSESRLLAIYKRPQTITFPKVNPPKFKKKNQRFLLNATSTSGQPITYTSSSSAIRISGNVAIMRKKGKADITASQAGDSIYLPAQPVAQQVKVK